MYKTYEENYKVLMNEIKERKKQRDRCFIFMYKRLSSSQFGLYNSIKTPESSLANINKLIVRCI
jgi:hypothetical protein